MAQSNLATIDALFADAISAEEQNPRLTERARDDVSYKLRMMPTTAFGFDAIDESAESTLTKEKRDERLEAIGRYRKDLDGLEESLKALGIEPKARGTDVGLSRIFFESDLYRLTVNAWGTVAIENDFVRGISNSVRKKLERWIVSIFTTILGVGAAYGSYSYEPHWMNLVAGLIGAAFGFMIGGTLNGYILTPMICYFRVPQKIRATVQQMTHTQLVAAVFPKKKSDPWSRSPVLPIRFPEPPADVAQKLAKLRNAKVEVVIVAAAEAIAFPSDVASLLAEAGREHVRRESGFRGFGAHADPIICAVNGTAMAIVDQFGKVTVEEETVRKIVNSDFLI